MSKSDKPVFDSQGRRLLPTDGLPKELLRSVMILQADWTREEIGLALDVMDTWNQNPSNATWTRDQIRAALQAIDDWGMSSKLTGPFKRRVGRPSRSKGKHDKDQPAVDWAVAEAALTSENRPYTLALAAIDAGKAGKIKDARQRWNAQKRIAPKIAKALATTN